VLDWEGTDWSARAHEAAWQIWFAPQAVVTHAGGTSLKQVTGRWIASSHLGMYRYFARRSSRPARALLAAVITGRALVKLAVTKAGVEPYKRIHRDSSS
jgi:GT2 family glycosyltransferase